MFKDARVQKTQEQLSLFMHEVELKKRYSLFSDITRGIAFNIYPVPTNLFSNIKNSLEYLKESKEGFLRASLNGYKLVVRATSITEKGNNVISLNQESEDFDEDIESQFTDVWSELSDEPSIKEKTEDIPF